MDVNTYDEALLEESIMKWFLVTLAALMVGTFGIYTRFKSPANNLKLYWFIPDGLRAEPDVFTIFKWAQEGELPNIKKLMEQGSYGYSVPVFPSHTPVNFAALLTGKLPKNNGVADGPMHTEGNPLDKVSVGGFSSTARKVPAIWSHFEDKGFKVGIISTPGSTPPEIDTGLIVRGRWGNWGYEMPGINIEFAGGLKSDHLKRENRFIQQDPQLTQYVSFSEKKWPVATESETAPNFFQFSIGEKKFFAALVDTTKDGLKRYDKVVFSFDGKKEVAAVAQQGWSHWLPLDVQLKGANLQVRSNIRFHVIKLDGENFFRIRVLFNSLNETLTQPSSLAQELSQRLGPMTDFVDNFPPQLIDYPEDKLTFLQEQEDSFLWHTKLIPHFVKTYRPDVVIHNIYNPNQMLTSRWWLGAVDPKSNRHASTRSEDIEQSWKELKSMYKQIDNMIGEVLKVSGDKTVVVLSSDHGVAALNHWVHINNLFVKKKWLKFKVDAISGVPIIDWENSTVVFLKMDNIYINPKGLSGKWLRAKGAAYLELRRQVINELLALKDSSGVSPIEKIATWENVDTVFNLPAERVGDLVVANRIGYGWKEEPTQDGVLFSTPLVAGYKQALLATETNSLWTPFVIMGPGVKKNNFIQKEFLQIHQLPTILKTMDFKVEQDFDGHPLDIFQ